MVDSYKHEIPEKSIKLVVTNNSSHKNYTRQGVPDRPSCLTSSPPGDVPPIVLPFQRKARSVSSEMQWVYDTDLT